MYSTIAHFNATEPLQPRDSPFLSAFPCFEGSNTGSDHEELLAAPTDERTRTSTIWWEERINIPDRAASKFCSVFCHHFFSRQQSIFLVDVLTQQSLRPRGCEAARPSYVERLATDLCGAICSGTNSYHVESFLTEHILFSHCSTVSRLSHMIFTCMVLFHTSKRQRRVSPFPRRLFGLKQSGGLPVKRKGYSGYLGHLWMFSHTQVSTDDMAVSHRINLGTGSEVN